MKSNRVKRDALGASNLRLQSAVDDILNWVSAIRRLILYIVGFHLLKQAGVIGNTYYANLYKIVDLCF